MYQRPRRTREEIMYEILRILNAIPKSHISNIMQKARLNYYQARNYLTELTKKEYIIGKNGIYILLDQGKEFIIRYEALKTIKKNPDIKQQ